MTPLPAPLPPRISDFAALIILSERARRERIITLDPSEYHEIPAHIAAAELAKEHR